MLQRKLAEAKKLVAQVLAKNPNHEQAKAIWQQLIPITIHLKYTFMNAIGYPVLILRLLVSCIGLLNFYLLQAQAMTMPETRAMKFFTM